MSLNVQTAVHGDVAKVEALRLKQGRNQDVGSIVDTAGGRPPSASAPVAVAGVSETPAGGVPAETVAAYVRVMAATANADRWQAVAQMAATPQTRLLAMAAIVEAREAWRQARNSTPFYDEAEA